MSYEIKIPLKLGTLEIEFDGVPELERKLRALDVARIERAVLSALHSTDAPKASGKAKKGRRTRRKKA